MKHKINVEGIKIYAFHGCLEEEGRIGANYIVDVYMTTDFSEAALTDDLSLTIDYCEVYNIAKEQMAIRSKLIEHVGKRIFDKISNRFPQLRDLHVRVTKLMPPMHGNVDKVSVDIMD